MTDNITLVQAKTGGYRIVTIHPIKIEEDFTGNPIVLMLPAPLAGSDAVTKFLNLNRVKRVITITGYLSQDTHNNGLPRGAAFQSYYAASSKGNVVATERTDLRDMSTNNRPIMINYVNEAGKTTTENPATWTMVKCKITESPEDLDSPKTYGVNVQLMEGTNLSG